MSLHSEKAENMFKQLCSIAGYENLTSSHNKEETVNKINTADPTAMDYVAAERAKKDKTTKWNLISISTIIDWVCGIDSIISPNGRDKWGFDVTLNPDAITKKVNKLKKFSCRWKCLGIKKVAVVLLVIPDEFDGMAFLSPENKELLVDTFLEDIVYAMDEQQGEVIKLMFTV